jgi:hypothetical protein
MAKVKVRIKGQETEAELASDVCYETFSKRQNKTIYFGRVKIPNSKGKEVVRFAQILDSDACKKKHVLNRKADKLVIGKRELPKLFRLVSGATPKAPAYIPGKLIAAMNNRQAKRLKRQKQEQKQE